MPLNNFPFLWNSEKNSLLRIRYSFEVGKYCTYSLNYSPLLKKVMSDLERWISLLLSLIGRIN